MRHCLMFLLVMVFGFPAPGQRRRLEQTSKEPPSYFQYLLKREDKGDFTRVVLKNGLTILTREHHVQPVVSILASLEGNWLGAPGLVLEQALRRELSQTPIAGLVAVRPDAGQLGLIVRVLPEQADEAISWLAAVLKKIPVILGEFQSLPGALPGGPLERGDREMEESLLGSGAWDPAEVSRRLSGSRPSDWLVVIAGDVEREKNLARAIEGFRTWAAPGGAVQPPRAEEAPSGSERVGYRMIREPLAQAYVHMAFSVPGMGSPESPALEMLAALLGKGRASLLGRVLGEEKKLARFVNADYRATWERGMLLVRMALAPADLDRAELGVLALLENLRGEEIDPVEMERARTVLELEHWADQEALQGMALKLAFYERGPGFAQLHSPLENWQKVTPKAVQEAAAGLTLDRCRVLEFYPESAETRDFTPESHRRALGLLLPASQAEFSLPEYRVPLDRLHRAPSTREFRGNQLQFPLKRASVLRGPDFYYQEDESLPLTSVSILFAGGRLEEDEGHRGMTGVLQEALLRGNRIRGADWVDFQLDLLGARVEPILEDDFFGYSLCVLASARDEAVQFFNETLTEPEFQEGDLPRLRATLLARRGLEVDHPLARSRQALRHQFFGQHAYGLPRGAEPSVVDNVTVEALSLWHREHFKGRQPLVAAVGQVAGTSLAPLFVKTFSGSETAGSLPQAKIPAPGPRGTKELEFRASCSIHELGLPGFSAEQEEGIPLDVLAHFPFPFRHATAYVITGIEHHRRKMSGMFQIEAVGSAPSESVLREIQDEIARLKTEPIQSMDLLKAIRASVLESVDAQQVRSRKGLEVAAWALWIGDGEVVARYPELLKAVGKADLKNIAEQVVRPDLAASVLLRPPK